MTGGLVKILSEDEVREIRAGIPALQESTYLNTGGAAPTPRAATDAIVEMYERIGQLGYYWPDLYDEIPRRIAGVRGQLARFLGADADEIALLRNTTEGLNVVARGLAWQAGDEVIISDQENPAALLPYANLQRRGVVIRRLRLRDEPSRILADVRSLLTPRTRLIVVSHVTHVTGLVLPFEAICSLGRAAGVPILWDGAQAVGQVPLDLHQSGCDFYSACGHKWLLGPYGTGFLYVRRDWLDRLDVTDIGVGSQESLDLETLAFRLKGSAQRYEYGGRAWAPYLGLAAGISLVEQVGVDAIRLRTLELVEVARQKLATIPQVRMVSSTQPERTSGILTIAIPGHDPRDLKRRLWEEHRVIVQWRDLPLGAAASRGIRLSLAFFTTKQEIDCAIEALQRVLD